MAIAACTQAIAQQDTLAGKTEQEVVVTANKIAQKQNTTGKVITVIGKDVLEKSAGKSVAQVLNETVGITINGALNNAGTNQTVFMRGANSGRTLILLDGVPMNDPSQISGDFDLNLFSINDVEKIEVCRGAQSTLYGSDAVAGVINIITVKNNIATPINVKATIVGGNLNTQKANAQLYGKVGKLTYTTRYNYLSTNGFSSASDTTTTKGFDNDSYKGNLANASLVYAVSKNFLLKGFGMYSRYKAGVDAGTFADDKFYTITNTNQTAGAGFVYKNDKVNIVGNYQYNQTERNFLRDSGDKAVFSFYQSNVFFSKSQFAELYASIKLGKGFTLLQGLDYRYGSMNNDYLSVSSFGPFKSKFNDSSLAQTSLYTSLLFNSKQWNFDIGGRFNKHSKYGENYTFTFNPSYTVNEHLQLFGSIASAFKAPSLYQLYANINTSFPIGNPDLQPEKSITYEAGVAHKYSNYSSRVVVFYRSINTGIDYNNVKNRYFNFIKQSAIGLEYESNVKLSEHFSFSFNATLLSLTDSIQSRITFKDTAYLYALRRPATTLNLSIQYQLKNLFVSIGGKYVSGRYDVGAYKKADIALNEYFIAQAYASYTFNKHTKTFIDCQNLTSTTFFDLRGYNSIPRLLSVGLSVNF